MYKTLTEEEIYELAMKFRLAILKVRNNRGFDMRDRMSNFPGGCCDDASDLFAYYLYENYKINTKQEKGRYSDEEPENTTNHVWLVTDEDIIIDITADQFEFGRGLKNGVYVGSKNDFYMNLEDKEIYENYDITQNNRLWNDYNIIVSNIQECRI